MKIHIIKINILMLIFVCAGIELRAQSSKDEPHILELIEYKTHLVQSGKPYKYVDKDRKEKESKIAYLVTFTFSKPLTIMDTPIDFYIGEYKIPEYGMTENGIYFRLIDPSLLDKLNAKAITYQFGSMKRASLKREFIKPNTKDLKVEKEDDVVKRKKP